MRYPTLMRGRKREIRFGHETIKAQPEVYCGGHEDIIFALYFPDDSDSQSWGGGYTKSPVHHLSKENKVVTMWRAFKVAERLDSFTMGEPESEEGDTLTGCYLAARRGTYTLQEARYVERFLAQTGGAVKREEVLKQFPTMRELNRILKVLEKEGMKFDERELVSEVFRGNIVDTGSLGPTMRVLMNDYRKRLEHRGF